MLKKVIVELRYDSFMPNHTVIRIKKDESSVPQVCITVHQSVQEIVQYFVNRCLQFQKSANNTQNLFEKKK